MNEPANDHQPKIVPMEQRHAALKELMEYFGAIGAFLVMIDQTGKFFVTGYTPFQQVSAPLNIINDALKPAVEKAQADLQGLMLCTGCAGSGKLKMVGIVAGCLRCGGGGYILRPGVKEVLANPSLLPEK